MKIKLKLVVNEAKHFLKWELPYFKNEFILVDKPGDDVVIFAYGPDTIEQCIGLPALKKVALLFPGFNFNPYHNLDTREHMLNWININFDAVLVNPGPIAKAFKGNPKFFTHPFSVDISQVLKYRRIRTTLNNLVHISADSPQKDWERSKQIMQLTNLPNEVFPSREKATKITFKDRINFRYQKYILKIFAPQKAFLKKMGYVSHQQIMKKYRAYDGFVHIAAEKPDPYALDGKYTATLLEAGITGSIIFWHDTFNLGNDFETIFSLSKDPEVAANEILTIKKNIDVARHSKLTSDEICDRCNPSSIIKFRRETIEKII